ncbi:MAG: hypothetical protein BGO87_09595 [Flavobacteriia bacterium 40-80]|nr:MAG: hypothetical protein BGO87_09595 [Flavobacteriia bacterium 40-80]
MTFSYAEGSKDLYPAGAQGGRAWLYSGAYSSFAIPFPTQGEHYVYVNAGEWISMATSYQGLNSSTASKIELYDPYGNAVSLTFSNTNTGKIPGRASELAGPHFPTQSAAGNQYDGVYHHATISGIYKVLLKTNLSSSTSYTGNIGNFGANENWTQPSNTNLIVAWDISVCNSSETNWIPGRVYAYNFVMEIPMPTQNPYKGGLYNKFKILTNDGFVYNVNMNGQNGIGFSFMVNSRGFYQPQAPTQPIYKSINITGQNAQWIANRYHDPRLPDDQFTVTHKIFYNLPDGNIPATAIGGHIPGQSTWLLAQQPASVSNLSFAGAETTPNQMASNKGGYIRFNSSNGGNYSIKISPATGTQAYTPRILYGVAAVGSNEVYFDGKDGNGNELPEGVSNITIEFNLGEVHFPFFDMELNPNGIIIERYNQTFSSIESDTVFWDDSDIPLVNTFGGPNVNPAVNLNGISSNINGHKWGYDNWPTYNWSGQGDNMGMDTWAYLKSPTNTMIQIVVKKADLKVNVTADKSSCVQAGDEITYTIHVKNDGPSDVDGAAFLFELSNNLNNANSAGFNSAGCGTEAQPLSFNTGANSYSSSLNLPAGCEVTYTIKVNIATNATSNVNTVASILRPNDVNDPDATNPALLDVNSNPYQPDNIQEECTNNIPQSSNGCNNIANNSISILLHPVFSQIADICAGDNFNLPTTSDNGIQGVWSPAANNTQTTTYIFSPNAATCADTIMMTVVVYQKPVFNVSFTAPSDCQSSDGTIILSGLIPDETYHVSLSNFDSVVTTNQNGEIIINNISNGIYSDFEVSLNGCTGGNSISLDIKTPDFPVLNMSSNVTICENHTAAISVSYPGNGTITWNHGLGNSSSQNVAPNSTTIYTVIYKDGYCMVTDSVIVFVKPLPNVSAGNDISVCEGDLVVLSGTGSSAVYSWDNNIINGTPFNIYSTTTYTVTGISADGCKNTDQVTVSIDEVPVISFVASDTQGCAPQLIMFDNTTIGGIGYTWSFGDGATSHLSEPNHVYKEAGCYDITLTATNSTGCSSSQVFENYICIHTSPNADFAASDYTLNDISNTINFTNLSENATSYQWDFGDSTTSALVDPQHIYHNLDLNQSYYTVQLIASNEYGCADTAIAVLKTKQEIIFFVPNCFTPDGDGFNNIFKPVFVEGLDLHDYSMEIYDRWGELIFETYNVEIGWDGVYKVTGKIVQDGIYVWKIKVKIKDLGNRIVKTGHITVLR